MIRRASIRIVMRCLPASSAASSTTKARSVSAQPRASRPVTSRTAVITKNAAVKNPTNPMNTSSVSRGSRCDSLLITRIPRIWAQPFTPPAVSPATMRRWKTSTSTTSGIVTITPAAMTAVYGSWCG